MQEQRALPIPRISTILPCNPSKFVQRSEGTRGAHLLEGQSALDPRSAPRPVTCRRSHSTRCRCSPCNDQPLALGQRPPPEATGADGSRRQLCRRGGRRPHLTQPGLDAHLPPAPGPPVERGRSVRQIGAALFAGQSQYRGRAVGAQNGLCTVTQMAWRQSRAFDRR